MRKITIEGPESKFLAGILVKHMRDLGLKVNYWREMTPSEVPNARRDATRENADVSIVAMTR